MFSTSAMADGMIPIRHGDAAAMPRQSTKSVAWLYVAMTRAKNKLVLVNPLKYFVPEQPRLGDRHVYGAKSRFLTGPVLTTFAPGALVEPAGCASTLGPVRAHRSQGPRARGLALIASTTRARQR